MNILKHELSTDFFNCLVFWFQEKEREKEEEEEEGKGKRKKEKEKKKGEEGGKVDQTLALISEWKFLAVSNPSKSSRC